MFDKNEPSEGIILVCQNAKRTYEKRLSMSHQDGSRQAYEHRRANGGLQTLGVGTQTRMAKRKRPRGSKG